LLATTHFISKQVYFSRLWKSPRIPGSFSFTSQYWFNQ